MANFRKLVLPVADDISLWGIPVVSNWIMRSTGMQQNPLKDEYLDGAKLLHLSQEEIIRISPDQAFGKALYKAVVEYKSNWPNEYEVEDGDYLSTDDEFTEDSCSDYESPSSSPIILSPEDSYGDGAPALPPQFSKPNTRSLERQPNTPSPAHIATGPPLLNRTSVEEDNYEVTDDPPAPALPPRPSKSNTLPLETGKTSSPVPLQKHIVKLPLPATPDVKDTPTTPKGPNKKVIQSYSDTVIQEKPKMDMPPCRAPEPPTVRSSGKQNNSLPSKLNINDSTTAQKITIKRELPPFPPPDDQNIMPKTSGSISPKSNQNDFRPPKQAVKRDLPPIPPPDDQNITDTNQNDSVPSKPNSIQSRPPEKQIGNRNVAAAAVSQIMTTKTNQGDSVPSKPNLNGSRTVPIGQRDLPPLPEPDAALHDANFPTKGHRPLPAVPIEESNHLVQMDTRSTENPQEPSPSSKENLIPVNSAQSGNSPKSKLSSSQGSLTAITNKTDGFPKPNVSKPLPKPKGVPSEPAPLNPDVRKPEKSITTPRFIPSKAQSPHPNSEKHCEPSQPSPSYEAVTNNIQPDIPPSTTSSSVVGKIQAFENNNQSSATKLPTEKRDLLNEIQLAQQKFRVKQQANNLLPKDPYDGLAWYHPNIERQDAISKLKRMQGDGTFLIRKSAKDPTKPYTLDVMYRSRDFHVPIRKVQDDKYAIGSSATLGEMTWSSIDKMVDYFKGHELNLTSAELCGKVMLNKSPGHL